MKQSWISGLDEQAAKDIKGDFKSSLLVRKRLIAILEDKYAEADTVSLSTDEYKSPSWAYKQADLVGYKRALRLVQSLLKDTPEEK